MTDITHKDDIDTTALFAEIEKERLNDYETCSASETFDAAFQCYTLGAQAINYYRYGSKKDCAGKWEDFKFCLKTKTKSSEVADAMLRERKINKEAAKMRGRNSEEIWEAR